MNELCAGAREYVCVCVWVYWLSRPSRVRKTSCAHDFIPCSAGWDHSRWVASTAAPPAAAPAVPAAPLPFACGRTGQPPRHVSSWVACWFRLYQITTIDYACLLSPVDTLSPPSPNLSTSTPSPLCACQCPVLSCRVLALYITVCARVGLHNAPFSACRSLLPPGASSPPRAAPVAVPFAFALADDDDGDDVVVVVASVDVAVVDDE